MTVQSIATFDRYQPVQSAGAGVHLNVTLGTASALGAVKSDNSAAIAMAASRTRETALRDPRTAVRNPSPFCGGSPMNTYLHPQGGGHDDRTSAESAGQRAQFQFRFRRGNSARRGMTWDRGAFRSRSSSEAQSPATPASGIYPGRAVSVDRGTSSASSGGSSPPSARR